MRLQPSLFPAAERQWRAVDVVLDCFLVEEGKHHGGFASEKNMVKALLVLKQVPVLDDGSLEGFTDFQMSTLSKDNPPVTFEASGKSLHVGSCSAPSTGTPQFPGRPTCVCFPCPQSNPPCAARSSPQ